MILAIIISLGILLSISFGLNLILVSYIRKSITKLFVMSEEASEIFSRLNTYEEHLKSVYEMPVFYGDETLAALLEHSRDLVSFMKKYDDVYSFTQPDLEEQLLAASEDLKDDEHNDQQETQEN